MILPSREQPRWDGHPQLELQLQQGAQMQMTGDVALVNNSSSFDGHFLVVGESLADHGLTIGETLEHRWGAGVNENTFTVAVINAPTSTPEPSSMILVCL